MVRKVLLLFVFIAFCQAAGAKSIAFQLIQHDGASDDVRTSSYIIEDTLFDYFFSLGFIVTNSPAVAAVKYDLDDWNFRTSLKEAREGGCDYFIFLVTEYDLTATTSPQSLSVDNLKSAQWKLIDVKTDAVLKTGIKKPLDKKASSVQAGVGEFVCNIADDILEVLYSRK